jgi:transposase, IS5 family
MRQLFREQLPLIGQAVDHPHARELQGMDRILRDHPGIIELVLQDLRRGVGAPADGRNGMSADQVLRAAVLKQLQQWTYDELSFHLADSTSYRAFCGLGTLGRAPSRGTLQRNIKRIGEASWEAINRILLGAAARHGVENGRKVRTDGTVIQTNVHQPTDSSLLWDAVRVLTRLLVRARDLGATRFPERLRRAKRRSLGVLNARTERQRRSSYRDLIAVTEETVGYAHRVRAELKPLAGDPAAVDLAAQLEHYTILAEAVIDQTRRRVLLGEAVAACDKFLSIFEDHTDIIVKDKRPPQYGHKLTLSAGGSGLILDWVVEDGNPADSSLVARTVQRLAEIYGQVPRQMAFDGCYASKDNLREAKTLGVRDVAFSKKRGLEVLDMARSEWVYKRLTNFRAGVEAWISFLKRSFGLERCAWRGWPGFRRYVGASIVAANLLTLARHLQKLPAPQPA